MNTRALLLLTPLVGACAPTSAPPEPCTLEALVEADSALAARADAEARRGYEALLRCSERDELAAPARAGLALLATDDPPTPAIAAFLDARRSSNPALEVLLERLHGAPAAMGRLCAWLGDDGRDDADDEGAAARRRGQHVRCLERRLPPADPLAELRAHARLQSLTRARVHRLAGLGVASVSAPIRACLERPEQLPPPAATCDDPFPAGALSRLALLASEAVEAEPASADLARPRESARCLRRLGLDACLGAIAGGCGCEGWQVVQPALWDALGPASTPEAVDAVRQALGLDTLAIAGAPWRCEDAVIRGLKGDTASLRALRLLHISVVQALLPDHQAARDDYACAHRLTCALGDPETLRRYLPGMRHAGCTPAPGPEPAASASAARCGDGRVDKPEECDDGNRSNKDACTNQCKQARCGDGFVQAALGEACDDGNDKTHDACVLCQKARCGDGFKGPHEACDDGNKDNTDSCTDLCRLPVCGDGLVQGDEACDDGNKDNTDQCARCKKARCGDGYVQPKNGEECDPGPRIRTRGCSLTCKKVSPGRGEGTRPSQGGTKKPTDSLPQPPG